MSSENKNIINLIDNIRGSLAKRQFLFITLSALSIAALVIFLIGLAVPKLGLREDQFLSLLLFTFIIPVAGFLFAAWKFQSSKLSRQDVAVKVEEAKPELMDAYACAVDIAEKGGPEGPIEEALTRQLKSKFQNGEINSIVIPSYLKQSAISAMILVTVLLAWVAFGSPLMKGAMFHVKVQANPELAGVSVNPGNVSLPKGKDLCVEASVKRGDLEAKLEYNMGGSWKTLEMFHEGEGEFTAVVYGVDSDFQYRVVTPQVSSEEYRVKVFLEPEIKTFKLSAKPPEYMNRKVITASEFKDIVVPESSTVVFDIKANKDCKVDIVESKSVIPAGGNFKEQHVYTFKAVSTHIYSITLKDEDGNTSTSKPFKVSIVKDMPPHIEVTKPAKDVKKYKEDIVSIEVNALDDFGLSEVKMHYEFTSDVEGRSINDAVEIDVFKAGEKEKVLERNFFQEINLKELAAKEGDIIYYYFTAVDNKSPIPQNSRTKIYFIEVRPDKSDTQDQEQQEGDQQEQQITVNDLIALQKDLIRKVIDVRRSAESDKGKFNVTDEQRQQLSSDTATLKLEVQKRYDSLKKEAEKMQASLGKIGEYFQASIDALQESEKALNEDLLNDGMKQQNRSLHNLIKIAIELEKNTQKSKSKSKQPPQEQQQQEQEENEDERLADMLEKLEELEEKQKDLNKEMRDKENKEELAQQELQKQMKEQQKKMEELADELEEMKQQDAAQQMQQAAQQQQQANQQQQQGNSEGAEQQSQQAEQSIENATNEIKRAMRDKARQKLQNLAKKLDKTIEKQNEIQEKTSGLENPKSEEGKKEMAGLKGKQDEVQKEMEDIIDQLGAAANELDEKYPEVAEALRESREFASNQGIQRRLKRSSNALHYKRKEAAEREQEKATDAMNLLGHKVRDAINRLPQATLDELLKMRQQMEMVRRQVGASQGGQQSSAQAKQMSQQISEMMKDMGERLKNDDLQNKLPEFLDAANKSGNAGAITSSQMKAVNQAAFILETLINQADLEKRLSLNRRTGAAPDKYRRSVREYLKSLSVQEK